MSQGVISQFILARPTVQPIRGMKCAVQHKSDPSWGDAGCWTNVVILRDSEEKLFLVASGGYLYCNIGCVSAELCCCFRDNVQFFNQDFL